ncbi:MAG: 3-dehydroquinate synthase [Alphaproteobacteria bacterium]|nr:3-dehydroquinate synthase [Alphaproteobacteria bacterium]MBT4965630.1 3-dehydroquinate synthase [Alphaproteobacteria bacterium]MBT5159499.1 3-dehydroquinate synthase [Alphaproteobacteria bacterium]MBT5918763.1 3-dehydroquinate synthase [Alphaproteobacteria bacterium]MBT6387043.1 3-dehydroquinate synthase [Alphaproteobacteria bacterium]
MQQFSVPFAYPVYFTKNMFAADNEVFIKALTRLESHRQHRFVTFIDAGVADALPNLADDITNYAQANAETIDLVAAPEIISGGEGVKNDPDLIARLQKQMLDLRIDRHSFVMAIGGGAFLDMIGYVAATTHRGLRLIRVPTTVLAQNDSGVGVKTGVNAWGSKNLLGSFAPPFAVINDSTYLASLNERDRRAGMAEAVKVALIRDGSFFAALEANAEALARFDPPAVNHLIRRCAELHMHQIAFGGDPFEAGSARPLDYGHWAAHKLESITDHAVRHGEAVAIGLALDTRYSVAKGLLAPGNEDRVCALLDKLGFDLWHPALEMRNEDGILTILAGLREFREHLGGELTITLLTGIGTGHEVNEMDEAIILDSLAWLKNRASNK